jgi:hypothetical protein
MRVIDGTSILSSFSTAACKSAAVDLHRAASCVDERSDRCSNSDRPREIAGSNGIRAM